MAGSSGGGGPPPRCCIASNLGPGASLKTRVFVRWRSPQSIVKPRPVVLQPYGKKGASGDFSLLGGEGGPKRTWWKLVRGHKHSSVATGLVRGSEHKSQMGFLLDGSRAVRSLACILVFRVRTGDRVADCPHWSLHSQAACLKHSGVVE